jgi:hypothetical protein
MGVPTETCAKVTLSGVTWVLGGAARLKQSAEQLAAVFQRPACKDQRGVSGTKIKLPTAMLAQFRNWDYFFCQVIPPSGLVQISLLVESTTRGGLGALPGRGLPSRSMFVTSEVSCWPFMEGCTCAQLNPPSVEWKSVPACPPVHISWPWLA